EVICRRDEAAEDDRVMTLLQLSLEDVEQRLQLAISLRTFQTSRAVPEANEPPALRIAPFRSCILQGTGWGVIAGFFIVDRVQHLRTIGPIDLVLRFVFAGKVRHAVGTRVKNSCRSRRA